MVPYLPSRIAKNIPSFTGRAWLVQPILDWLKGDQRMFILAGDPGAGKSMVAAWVAGLGNLPQAGEVPPGREWVSQTINDWLAAPAGPHTLQLEGAE